MDDLTVHLRHEERRADPIWSWIAAGTLPLEKFQRVVERLGTVAVEEEGATFPGQLRMRPSGSGLIL